LKRGLVQKGNTNLGNAVPSGLVSVKEVISLSVAVAGGVVSVGDLEQAVKEINPIKNNRIKGVREHFCVIGEPVICFIVRS